MWAFSNKSACLAHYSVRVSFITHGSLSIITVPFQMAMRRRFSLCVTWNLPLKTLKNSFKVLLLFFVSIGPLRVTSKIQPDLYLLHLYHGCDEWPQTRMSTYYPRPEKRTEKPITQNFHWNFHWINTFPNSSVKAKHQLRTLSLHASRNHTLLSSTMNFEHNFLFTSSFHVLHISSQFSVVHCKVLPIL